jgi:hypothetical protein
MIGFVLCQSLMYPKLWTDALANPDSLGNQSRGQNSCSSSSNRHVFIDPPRRPCTKIRSIRASGAEYRIRKPSWPILSSLSATCVRADPKLRVKKELPFHVSALGRSSCPRVGVFSVAERVGASEKDEGKTPVGMYFEREREGDCAVQDVSQCESVCRRNNLLPTLHRRDFEPRGDAWQPESRAGFGKHCSAPYLFLTNLHEIYSRASVNCVSLQVSLNV